MPASSLPEHGAVDANQVSLAEVLHVASRGKDDAAAELVFLLGRGVAHHPEAAVKGVDVVELTGDPGEIVVGADLVFVFAAQHQVGAVGGRLQNLGSRGG